MRTSDKPCKIKGVTCGEASIRYGGTGEISLKTLTALQDADGNVHGKMEWVGPWSTEVSDLVMKLKDAVEAHMETIHFEVEKHVTEEDYGAAAPGEDSKPTGLFGTGLGAAKEPEVDQV